MNKLSTYKDAIITNLISNIIWYIFSVLFANVVLWFPLLKGVYLTIKNSEYSIPIYAFVLIAISVIFMFILVVILINVIVKLYKNNDDITADLIFDTLDIELFFKDRENIISNLTYKCIVNKEGYNEFSKDIIWTGHKYNYTKIMESNGNYTLTDSNRKSSPYKYFINFNKTFSIGDDLYLKLETSVNDEDHSMSPVFSHMVKHQINNFIINLTVPVDLVKNVRPTVYRDIHRTIEVPNDIRIIQKNVGNLIQYSYKLEKPNLLNNYCIEWDFK